MNVVVLPLKVAVAAQAEAVRLSALRSAVLGDLEVANTELYEDDLTIADRIQLANERIP